MNNLKSRILRKSNLWHLGAILLFVIISCSYLSPALKDYSVKQADVVNYIGASREVADFRENSGEQILWTNSMFSGMPSTQISIRYEGTWFSRGITNLVRLGLPRPISYMFIYFISFYILSLSLRIKPLIGIIGSIAFGLSSYFIVILEAGHNSKAAAIGLAPLMIAGFIMSYRFKNWTLGVALSSLFMMIELAANHVQITYYMAFVLLLMGLVELIKHIKDNELFKFVKVTSLLVVGYAFAVMVNYGNLFGTIDYSKQTIRGGTELTINADGSQNDEIKTSGLDRDYVTNWSYGRAETFTLMVPNYKGGETQAIGQNEANDDIVKDVDNIYRQNVAQSNQYWGDQPFTSGPVYVGIIVMFLAFLGLVYAKDKYKWALLSVTLLAITLSWGKNYVSAFVLLPILLYMVNVFLENKNQLIFSAINTLLLFFAIRSGDMIMASSLTDFFLDYLPGYDKLRAVTIILVVAELCIPLLGILFLQRLFKSREEIVENMKGFYIVTGVLGLFLIVLLISPGTFNTFISAQETGMIDSVFGTEVEMQYASIFGALEDTRIAIFKSDVLRSLGFFVLGAGLIFAFLRMGFSKIILGACLALFILLDLTLVDQRYLNTDGQGKKYDQWVESYEIQYPYYSGDGEDRILAMEMQKNPVIAEKLDSAMQVLNADLKGQKDMSAREKEARRDFLTFRILNNNSNFRVYEEGNPYNSSYTSYFNKSIGGYHGAKLGRYQDLIDFHIAKGNPSVVDMLNTKYFLRPSRDNNGKINNTVLTKINPGAMGNAWFTKEVKLVANANEEITSMDAYKATVITKKGNAQVFVNDEPIETGVLKGADKVAIQLPGMAEPYTVTDIPYQALDIQALALIVDSTGINWIKDSAPDTLFDKVFSIAAGGKGGWDPAKTTIADVRFTDNIGEASYSGNGTIEMTSYHPDHMVYSSSSSDKQLAVFSEMYYEGGWKAFIDDQEVPVSRLNYVLRGVEVPAGDHEIRFEFSLESFEKSKTMALIGTFAILLLLAAGFYLETKTTQED